MAASRKSKAVLSLVVDNDSALRRQKRRAPVEPLAPRPVKAELPALSADMTVAAACHAVLRSCFTHLLDNRLPVLKGDDAEAVHQARVALRRLRAAIAIFRPVMHGGELNRLGDEARWLASEMGPVRDLDVFMDEIFAPVARRLAGQSGLTAYRTAGRALQKQARERARRALRSRRFKAWRDRMESWLAADIAPPLAQEASDTAAPLYRPVSLFAAEVLDKRHKGTRRKGRHLARLNIEERHALRLGLKKLRYAAEFFASAFPEEDSARYTKRLAKLQDALGYLNDQAVAEPVMAQIEARIAEASSDLQADARYVSGLVSGWHEAGHIDTERDLRRAWKRFMAVHPFWN